MNNILKFINEVSGNNLAICIQDYKIIQKFEKKSDNLYSINKEILKSRLKKAKIKLDEQKKINFKKLNKYFKKKSIDYIICNFDDIKSYSKYFVRNSIAINSKKLLIYSKDEEIIEMIVKKYKRYDVSIKKEKQDGIYILIIDNTKSHNKKFDKEFFYYIIDSLQQLGDFISNLLVS